MALDQVSPPTTTDTGPGAVAPGPRLDLRTVLLVAALLMGGGSTAGVVFGGSDAQGDTAAAECKQEIALVCQQVSMMQETQKEMRAEQREMRKVLDELRIQVLSSMGDEP